MDDSKLAKKLGLIDIFLWSLSYIIGSGIFILISTTSKYVKNYSWVAFLFAGLFSVLNIISYIELNSVFKSNKCEYDYVGATFGKEMGFIVAITLVFIYILSNTTVALAMGDCVKHMFGLNKYIVAVLIIIIFTIINIIGVKQSSNINSVSISIIVTGLIIFIVGGLYYIATNKSINNSNATDFSTINNFDGLKNVFYTGFLAMFAYSGFETTVKLTEESINPTRDIPIALFGSLFVAIILYTLIAYILTNIKHHKYISKSVMPITDVAKMIFNSKFGSMFSLLALLSIMNTILIGILGGSRLLHSISSEYEFMNYLTYVNDKTKTPIIAILIISIISLILLFIKNVEKAVTYTNFLLFLVILMVNISLFFMHFKNEYKANFNTCIVKDINKYFPIIPLLAIILNVAILSISVFYRTD